MASFAARAAQGHIGRARRLATAFGHIRNGAPVLETALDQGYDSLSGFNAAFAHLFGVPPRAAARERTPIAMRRMLTPLGPMLACATPAGLCLLEFADRRMLERQLRRIGRRLAGLPVPGPSPILDRTAAVLERYPNLRIAFGESGIGWIPYALDRMDFEWDDRFRDLGLTMKPSDYWRRQCKATFQFDRIGTKLIDEMGVETLMWASDYPHTDGVWPESSKYIEEQFGHLPADVVRKITCENAGKFYGLM